MTAAYKTVEIPEPWLALLQSLRTHDVQFVVAGSAADAIAEERPLTAARLVIAPAPYRRNLERLAAAFAGARLELRRGGEQRFLDAKQLVQHPALKWPLTVDGVELDVIGSAVGDGEFSIRVWRTRPIELTAGDRSLVAEVELLAGVTPAIPV